MKKLTQLPTLASPSPVTDRVYTPVTRNDGNTCTTDTCNPLHLHTVTCTTPATAPDICNPGMPARVVVDWSKTSSVCVDLGGAAPSRDP